MEAIGYTASGTMTPPRGLEAARRNQSSASTKNKPPQRVYIREELIMPKSEFEEMKAMYEQIKEEQSSCQYRTRFFLSNTAPCKYFCCCVSVQDRLNLQWQDMSDRQKRYRIK